MKHKILCIVFALILVGVMGSDKGPYFDNRKADVCQDFIINSTYYQQCPRLDQDLIPRSKGNPLTVCKCGRKVSRYR